MSQLPEVTPQHSTAWVAQTWLSFALSFGGTLVCLYVAPVDLWMKACLAMGVVFTVGSTFSLAKTLRDQHESTRLHKRIDDARLNRMISEHDPLKPAL